MSELSTAGNCRALLAFRLKIRRRDEPIRNNQGNQNVPFSAMELAAARNAGAACNSEAGVVPSLN